MSIFDTPKAVHFAGVLRCAEQRYNDTFVSHGRIKFGIPQKWVEEGEKYGVGRGDYFEGTFAACHDFNADGKQQIGNKYQLSDDKILITHYGNHLYYKNRTSLLLPTFCLYGINFDLFEIQPKTGWQKINGHIPGQYFQSFGNVEKDPKDLPVEKHPSVVWIKNLDEFKNRLILKLTSLGIEESEVIYTFISYYDFDHYGDFGWFDLNVLPPYELSIKHIDFKYQSEIRFIVNSKNETAMQRLRSDTIDIGSIQDIAQKVDGYFENGLNIEMKIDIESRN